MSKQLGGTILVVALATVGLVACGSVTPLANDGGTGHAGQTGGGGGGGSSAAGQGGAGAGGGGSSGAGVGGAGTSGGAGQGGTGGARDGGTDTKADAGNPCHGLTEPQCSATAGCMPGNCGSCSGGPSYAGCYQPATESAPPCPGFACPLGCKGLGEAACVARMDCRSDYCTGCQGAKSFSQCVPPDAPPALCPAIACLVPCAMVTTLDACETRTDCHSVFVDPGTCGCAAVGCCAKFNRCADGDKAQCKGMPLCRAATPFCEGKFVVSYTASCYEGCVDMKDCAP